MRQIILLLLFTLFINCTILHGQSDNKSNVCRDMNPDSILVKGRTIWATKHKRFKRIEPVEGVVLLFMDLRQRDSLLENRPLLDLSEAIDTHSESCVMTDKDGRSELKLLRCNYIVKFLSLCSYPIIVDIIPNGYVVDLGDIKLKEMGYDDSDFFIKTKRSHRKTKNNLL